MSQNNHNLSNAVSAVTSLALAKSAASTWWQQHDGSLGKVETVEQLERVTANGVIDMDEKVFARSHNEGFNHRTDLENTMLGKPMCHMILGDFKYSSRMSSPEGFRSTGMQQPFFRPMSGLGGQYGRQRGQHQPQQVNWDSNHRQRHRTHATKGPLGGQQELGDSQRPQPNVLGDFALDQMVEIFGVKDLPEGSRGKIVGWDKNYRRWVVRLGNGQVVGPATDRMQPMVTFQATNEWQIVPAGLVLPRGLDVHMDLETNQTFARLIPMSPSSSLSSTSLILHPKGNVTDSTDQRDS